MNVVLKNSRRIIGIWVQPISVERGIPLPHRLSATAYRGGQGIAWKPDPPPNPKHPVQIPFWCDRNSGGEIDMLIDESHEDLFRIHPLFRATT
jgi:hypothetical protein